MSAIVDKQLLEILACPTEDHAPLSEGTPSDPSAPVLSCTRCGRQYPVREGIPVLLVEEASLPGTQPEPERDPAAEPERDPAAGDPAAGDAPPDGAAGRDEPSRD